MEFRMTFGDLNGDAAARTAAINEAIQMAHQNPRHDTLVLPEGRIEVADGLEYMVDGDTSAALSIRGAGGDNHGTMLRGVGTGPTLKIGTSGGGNFRRCPIEGIAFQRRGVEFLNVGYGVLRDVAFHGVVSTPCIQSTQSYLRFESMIAQHCELLAKASGGSLRFSNSKLGEDLGGIHLLGAKLNIVGCEGHSLKSAPDLRNDANGNPWGVKPWIVALSGAKVRIASSDLSVLPDSSEPTLAENVCDTFMMTDRVRDIAMGGSDIHMGKGTSFITMRFQNSGTEPGATCIIGDDVIVTSDLDLGQKFTAFNSIPGSAGSGFDKAKFAGVIEVRDTTETGFEWGSVAIGQGLITDGAQVRLNTD